MQNVITGAEKMNAGRVSVIVPIYNVAEFLPECLESLAAQTYENLEVIAIDDGSTDESGRILDEYAARYPRIHAVHIANGGVSHARNVGLDIAKGEYICFVDSDDYVATDMYANLVAGFTDDVDMVCGGYVRVSPAGEVWDEHERYSERIVYDHEAALVNIVKDNIIGGILCDKLFRATLINGQSPRVRMAEDIFCIEDTLFVCEAMRTCRRVVALPLFAYYYREREKSMMHNPLTPGYLTAWAANKRLYAYALTESATVQEAMNSRVIMWAVGVGKLILMYDADRYARELAEIQSFIRSHLGLLNAPTLSLKMRVGAIYLAMPLWIVRGLSGIANRLGTIPRK